MITSGNINAGNIFTKDNETGELVYKKVSPSIPVKHKSRFSLFSILKKLIRFLSRTFTTCILLVAIAHFVPELREQLPELYIFIEDVLFEIFNFAYSIINNLILF